MKTHQHIGIYLLHKGYISDPLESGEIVIQGFNIFKKLQRSRKYLLIQYILAVALFGRMEEEEEE